MTDEAPAEQTARGTLGTVRNATLLLNLLSDGAPYQHLSDLAEESQASVPTVHRLLRSLAAAGLVEQDQVSLRYGLGPELVRLSERYLMRLPVLRAVAPFLVALRDETKVTVLAAILARGCVVYVDRVDGDDSGGVFREPLRLRPALETAAGRLLAARGGIDAWRQALGKGNGPNVSVEDRRRWAAAPYVVLAEARLPDRMIEVAVPVLDSGANTVAALAGIGSADRFTEETLVDVVAPQLARAAAAASRSLVHG